jgi:hypothetical protein
MPNRGLPRLTGGLRKREREAWETLETRTCTLRQCDEPAAGYVRPWNGAYKPICDAHIPQAEALGYTVERSRACRDSDRTGDNR